jgi:hypothetical protein
MNPFQNFSGSIVLTIIDWQLFSGNPLQVPTAGPRFRIRSRIINRYFIFQRVEVGASEPLDQMELIGMR